MSRSAEAGARIDACNHDICQSRGGPFRAVPDRRARALLQRRGRDRQGREGFSGRFARGRHFRLRQQFNGQDRRNRPRRGCQGFPGKAPRQGIRGQADVCRRRRRYLCARRRRRDI